MQVKDIYWFIHSSKIGNVSSGKIKDLIEYNNHPLEKLEKTYDDYEIKLKDKELKEYEELGLKVEHFVGI